MKTCPRCARTYPDAESFCEVDGNALTATSGAVGTAKMVDGREGPIECPVCGGKAEPGEVMCNFCGARLPVSGDAEPAGGPGPAQPTGPTPRRPETYIPARDKLTATEFTPPIPPDDEADEERRRPLISIVGYSAAAIVALAAGAWLAIHLSAAPAISPPKTVEASPAPTASPAAVVASGPTVDLAHSVQMQTFGESAAVSERSVDAARKVFESGKSGLLDSYRAVLVGGSAIDDGMVVRLTVAPSGAVTSAAVRTSTSSNPELDAAVVKTMMGWTFAPINGGEVSADYPIIFARDAAQVGAIDSGLASKVAALGATSSPEYASAPAALPSVSPPPLPPPPMEATTPVAAPPPAPRRRRHEVASTRPPKPSLLQQVQSALRSNRKLNRVNAYTNGGVVTLYGKVFDDNDKRLAVRTARSVSGVTDVIDQTTTDTAVWAARQQQISQALASAGLTGVTVKVIGRDAYLDGEVANKLDRERAVTITEGAAPVIVRTNLIRVAVGRVFGF